MQKMKAVSAVAIAFALALVATGRMQQSVWAGFGDRDQLLKLYGGREGIAVLQKPDKVEAFRVSYEGQDVKVASKPVQVDPAVAKQLGEILTAEKSYLWKVGRGCIPILGVKLSFYRGDRRLDVWLCFKCDILVASWNGEEEQQGYFDPVRPQLVAAVKLLFPDDMEIQGLPAKG